jgi:hypothetical protein
MYHDVAYRNDELSRDLKDASQRAARGWRFRHLQPGQPEPFATAMTVLGGILVEVGQRLAAQGRPTFQLGSTRRLGAASGGEE